jgi:sugar phosphate isomerase/epimerase
MLEIIDLAKRWIDHAVALNCPKVMVNQGSMPVEYLDEVIKTLKAISDYGKSKKVFVTLEPRGQTKADLVDVIQKAGAYSNADMGNYPDDETRHREMRRMYPMDTGSTHIKYAPERWNFEEAIKLWQSLGFKGIFALEGSGQDPYATTQRMLDALLPLM